MFKKKWHPVLTASLIFCVIGTFSFSLTDISPRFIKIYEEMSVSEGFITVLSRGIDCLVDDSSDTGKAGKNLLLLSRNNTLRTIYFMQIQNNKARHSKFFIHNAVDYHYFIDTACIQTRLLI
jgi:hypothetical protein